MTAARYEFRNVSKTYRGHTALRDVSCSFTAGEHTAILGPSGGGKTTALRLLAGLDVPTAGQVLLNNSVVSMPGRIVLPPHRRGLAMVFQDLALWPNLTVLGNVLLGLSGAALGRAEARRRAEESLQLCGIAELARRKPWQVSGGQQQRAALARAIAPHPSFLVLDEPFSGLDLLTKSRLFQDIARLVRDRDLTILLVTHDPIEATTLCDRALVFEDGRITAAGPFSELLRDPRSELLQAFQRSIRT